MTPAVIAFCLVMLAATILISLWRIAAGPSVMDRMLAFDLITVCGVGLIAVLSFIWETDLFIELVLVYSLMGFLGTVAFALFLYKTISPRNISRTGKDDNK